MQISSSEGLGLDGAGGTEKYVSSEGEGQMKEVPVDRIREDVSEVINFPNFLYFFFFFLQPVSEFVFSFSVLGLICLLDPSVSFFFFFPTFIIAYKLS